MVFHKAANRKAALSIGRVLLCISSEWDVSSFFPSQWRYQAEDQQVFREKIDLHLEMGSFHTGEERLTNGWNLIHHGEHQEAVYSSEGEVLFSLQYDSERKEVTVLICKLDSRCIKLGIQYGIMLALYRDYIGLHGVTLLCSNEIIILSAPSGTGKTTLAKLLEKYCDAIVINGDFALLSLTEDGVIFEPTPFCGTSGRALNHRFRVDRVVFLGQAKDNIWRELDGRTAMKQFMNNCFIPTWDSEVQKTVQENILKCADAVKVNAYAFAPTQEAAEEFLKHVEK